MNGPSRFVLRSLMERRATVRPDSIDRRGRRPTETRSPWVALALANRLPAGGPVPTAAERIKSRIVGDPMLRHMAWR